MHRQFFVVVSILILLAGCASVPRDDRLNELLSQRVTGAGLLVLDQEAAQAITAEILAEPLDTERAVRLALLNNPDRLRELTRLGIAHADVVKASRLPNPRLSLRVRDTISGGSGTDITTGLGFGLTELLMRPIRQRLSAMEYQRTRHAVAHVLVELASEVEKKWFKYAAARQVAEVRGLVAETASASAELAERFYRAGNISELQLRQEQAAATQAGMDARRADLASTHARLNLERLLGLPAGLYDWDIPERLPAIPSHDESADTLVQQGLEKRLDLVEADHEMQLLEEGLAMTRRWRWFVDAEIGVAGKRDTDGVGLVGPTAALQLPLFDQGQGDIALFEALLEDSKARRKGLELSIRRQVHAGLAELDSARALAQEYRDALIPLNEAIVARSLEMYDFMFIGAFELILARQAEYNAYQGYIETIRDYWLARVDLARAVGTSLTIESAVLEETIEVQELIRLPEPESEPAPHHHEHDMQEDVESEHPHDQPSARTQPSSNLHDGDLS